MAESDIEGIDKDTSSISITPEAMASMKDRIEEIMNNSVQAIKNDIRAKLQENITSSLEYSVRQAVMDEVQGYIKTELKPDIAAVLLEARPLILESLQASIIAIAAGMGAAMLEKANNTFGDDYKLRKVAKELFDY